MKKIFILFAMVAVLGSILGCAVKSELDKPNPNYPRNYPVY